MATLDFELEVGPGVAGSHGLVELGWVAGQTYGELEDALDECSWGIPMLLDDAALPTAAELLDDMADLAHHQACRLRWTSLDEDLTRLVAAVEPHLRVRE